jgi:putative ABC transport system permease protein
MFREGAEIGDVGSAALVSRPAVSADYFQTMRIPLRGGRLFRDGEPEQVVVVSESAARALWGGDDPIGRRLTTDAIPRQWFRVVGVVGDVLSEGLDRAIAPAIYSPFWQNGKNQFAMAVRSALRPEALSKEVREAVWRVDPEIPMADVRPLPTLVSQSAQQRRLQAILLAGFASIAVLLAAVGIYGVVAYSVARRNKELGLRMALGADTADIRRVVFRQAMAPILTGLAMGIVAGVGVAKGMSALLFHVSTLNPFAYLAAFLVLGLAGVLPCWMTAARASRTDPMAALRTE